jgi:hypothetical protein
MNKRILAILCVTIFVLSAIATIQCASAADLPDLPPLPEPPELPDFSELESIWGKVIMLGLVLVIIFLSLILTLGYFIVKGNGKAALVTFIILCIAIYLSVTVSIGDLFRIFGL